MNTAFSHALRVVLCPSCGEAIHGSPSGGEVRCSLCEAAVELGPRNEQIYPEGLSHHGEEERLARLRAQERRSIELPAELAHLVDDGRLARARLPEALAAWQRARARLDAGEGDAEDSFHALTLLLHGHMRGQGDDLQLRAVLETAFETLPSPRYRQVLRSILALEAARVGDVAAAEDWLAPCDARTYDLVADSAYRHAAAYVATLEAQPARVLEVLGTSGHDVPITADRDAVCTLLRAHAHERLGRLDDAVEELAAGLSREPDGLAAYERERKRHEPLRLCPEAFPRARRRRTPAPHAAAAEGKRRRRAALPWLVPALGCLVAAVALDPSLRVGGGHRVDMLFLALALSFALPALVLLARGARPRAR